LDEALFRRFDDVFQVPLPGPEEIEKLLKMTLSAVNKSDRISWKSVINELNGLSAAMVVKAAQDAAKAAVLGGQKIVTEPYLKDAIAEIKRTDDHATGR
jgi:ATP-dependent 26S proteasome regulatory subunit